MSYAVKELFLTLQGEGGQAGRAAVFCRFAGCNLWSGREQDREAAACSFCDTDFVGMDGPCGGRFATADALAAFAAGKGISLSQLSLAWLLAQRPFVVPIPGSKNRDRVAQNVAAADVELTRDDGELRFWVGDFWTQEHAAEWLRRPLPPATSPAPDPGCTTWRDRLADVGWFLACAYVLVLLLVGSWSVAQYVGGRF